MVNKTTATVAATDMVFGLLVGRFIEGPPFEIHSLASNFTTNPDLHGNVDVHNPDSGFISNVYNTLRTFAECNAGGVHSFNVFRTDFFTIMKSEKHTKSIRRRLHLPSMFARP